MFIGPSPPPYSGPEISMELFLESRLSNTYRIIFIKTNFRKTNQNKGKLDFSALLAIFSFFAKLLIALVRHRPVVAYYPITPTQLGWVGRDALCLLLCKLFGARSIIHLRGSHLKLNLQTFHPMVVRLVRLACRTVSLGIVQAECLRDQFDTLLSDDRVRVLYQAIDTKRYDRTTATPEDSLDVLFMGHLTQAKGYCDLLRCLPLVVQSVPNVRFLAAGTKRRGERGVFFNQRTGAPLNHEEPDALENDILDGPHHRNFEFLGVVTGQDKLDLMQRSAVFVLPSYSEGFSRAVLEAVSLGLPVVCTPVGAHAEVIRDGTNGFIVEPGDTQALAARITALLMDSSLRRSIGDTNYEYARKSFDIDIIATQFSQYIDQVIDETR